MTKFKSNSQILLDAADLLERPMGWIRGSFSRSNRLGYAVSPRSKNADCFCAIGAIRHAANEDLVPSRIRIELTRLLVEEGENTDIVYFNDYQAKIPQDVSGLFRRAAKRLAAKEAIS